jgi:heme exporter protein D
MGGYGGYVWPAYGISVIVLALVLLASVVAARKNEAELEQMQSLRRASRRNGAAEESVE